MFLRPGIILSAIIIFSVCVHAGSAPPPAANPSARGEAEADALLCAGLVRWDASTLQKLAQAINGLPETVACRALWQAASSPIREGAIQVFFAALSSPSAAVRRQAAGIMAGLDSPEALDLLLKSLSASGFDGEILHHVVAGLAAKPNRAAVRGLMRMMLSPGLKDDTVVEIAARLRNLTQASISDQPDAWKEWWLTNAQRYE